jgi:16S rRNA (uracil1498-N3)-methyltransferase
MQCHRPWLPALDEVTDLPALLQEPGVALADRDGVAPSLQHRLLLVGPEGGWAPEERAAAVAAGVPSVVLAPDVLRSETAAVAAGVLLGALRAGVVDPHFP